MLYKFQFDAKKIPDWEKFVAQMSSDLSGIRDGLYVFFFVNEKNTIVFDNNKGREKPIIYECGASLKPGKCENGIMTRLKNYQDHLHWVTLGGTKQWVFTQCLKRAYILDLSNCDIGLPSTARVFEQYWVGNIIRFLSSEKIWAPSPVRQLPRSEWKYLDPNLWNDDVENRLNHLIDELSERFLRMTNLARL